MRHGVYALQLTVNYNVYISGVLHLPSTAEFAGLLSWSTSSSDKSAAGRELASRPRHHSHEQYAARHRRHATRRPHWLSVSTCCSALHLQRKSFPVLQQFHELHYYITLIVFNSVYVAQVKTAKATKKN